MPDNPRDQALQVEIEDGRLVVSIGIDMLTSGILNVDAIDSMEMVITDRNAFAQEIALKLEAEEEDGTTLILSAFDRAAELAIEDGCDGIDEDPEADDAD